MSLIRVFSCSAYLAAISTRISSVSCCPQAIVDANRYSEAGGLIESDMPVPKAYEEIARTSHISMDSKTSTAAV